MIATTKQCYLVDRSPPQTPSFLEEATQKLLEVGEQKDINAVFLTRALQAILHFAEHGSLAEVATASSDYEMLLRMLESEESLELLKRDDPLAAARLRGLEMKRQLMEAEGGCISSEKAAKILGISRQAVDKRRKSGKLIGLPSGQRKYLYPLWQFSDPGTTIPGLESVLAELNDCDPWMQTAFMLDPNIRLDGKTPLEELRSGNVEKVRSAARTFGEHGAD